MAKDLREDMLLSLLGCRTARDLLAFGLRGLHALKTIQPEYSCPVDHAEREKRARQTDPCKRLKPKKDVNPRAVQPTTCHPSCRQSSCGCARRRAHLYAFDPAGSVIDVDVGMECC